MSWPTAWAAPRRANAPPAWPWKPSPKSSACRPQRDSQVLISAAEEANRRVLEAAHSDPSLEGMGTTLVAALELEGDLAIASVGDSRAYLLDDAGLHIITDDQTWVNEVGRPLGLDEESLQNHPMRHVLTMAIGASAPLTINYYSVPLSPGALVLICSDGLHGVVEAPQMEQILRGGRNGASLEESCRQLIEAAKEAGGPDNVTAVLVQEGRMTAIHNFRCINGSSGWRQRLA